MCIRDRQFTMLRARSKYPIDPGRHEQLVFTTDREYYWARFKLYYEDTYEPSPDIRQQALRFGLE